MVNLTPNTNTGDMVITGGTTSMLVLFLNSALNLMVPFLITAFVLIIVDLYFGIQAAKRRKEDVRPSTALRRTVGKIFEYMCWVILASTLAVAFKAEWIDYVVMAIVIGNEMLSVIDHYFFVHGKKIIGIQEAFIKLMGKKLDADTSDIKIVDIDKKNES